MSTSAPRSSTFLSRLRVDARRAAEHTVFTSVLGSVFLPRVGRRILLTAGGARVQSATGTRFTLTGSPRNLHIGDCVYFNDQITIEAIAPVSIGAGSAIGMQVLIVTSHHPIDEVDGSWSDVAQGRPVTIGERVWIGARAMILPGAVIEDDVVVAAGAVVSGRLSSHGVYAGVPAKRIRELAGAVPRQNVVA